MAGRGSIGGEMNKNTLGSNAQRERRAASLVPATAVWLCLACGGGTIEAPARQIEMNALVRVPVEVVEEPETAPPPQTGRAPARMLALGWSHSCALVEDGGIYCWGANGRGQLGLPGGDGTSVPQRVPGLGVMDAVWAGAEMTCAREAGDGVLQCWGDTGLGPNREPGVATPLPFSGVRAMSLGYRIGCFVDDRRTFCWGNYGAPHGPSWNTPHPVNVPRGVVGLTAGMQRHCGLDSRGRINCWGQPLAYWTPERVSDPVWRIEGLARVQMVALAGGPQGRPWIVDRHGHVQRTDVGRETRDHRSHAVELHEVPGVEDPATLVAGSGHACARLSNGTAACWGSNNRGQVGDGTTAERHEARFLELTAVQEIAAGKQHTCAIAAAEVYCWGSNDSGQAGAEPTNGIHQPQVIPW